MTSRLLETLGRAIALDTADLIWHWLDAVRLPDEDPQTPNSQHLAKIIRLIRDKRMQAAEEQIRLYLFDNPSCIRGRMAAAAVCLSQNQLQTALEQLNAVYMRQPNNTMALYALAHCYERLGKESEAVEFYQDCLKFKNHLQLPRQRLAAIYFKNGQLEKAILEYELLKDEYPDDMTTLVLLGYMYIANHIYPQAIDAFNTAILIHPDNYHTENPDIDQLVNDGQLQQALDQLEQLLEDRPERLDLALKRADILNMLGADAEAVSQYQQILRDCPDSLEATIKLGTQYLQTNQHQLAAQNFNKAVEINDRIVDAYIGLATAEKLTDNARDALATLSLAAAIQPNSSVLFAETASLQFQARFAESHRPNPEHSAQLIDAIIAAHHCQIAHRPQDPDLYYRLGILEISVGRLTPAINAFETALQINPTHTRAASKLIICLFETGQHDAALDQLTAGPDCLDSETLDLHHKTSLLYCDNVKFASSLINLECQLAENFTNTDATVHISVVLQNLGLLDRADSMWDNLSDTADLAANPQQPLPPRGL